jgi:hypothetical protein
VVTEDDVFDALTKCTGYDSAHTPKPSEIVVEAWMEHLSDFPSVTRQDLLDAVKEYHRTPRDVQLQPAHISAIARKYSRERYERSDLDSAERRRLEEVCNTKAAPEAALEAADSPSPAELGSGAVGGGGGAEKNATEEISRQRRQAIEAFAQRVGKPTPEIENRYLANLAQQRREGAKPIKVPCPDCGLLDPCEHDETEVAGEPAGS